MNTIHPILAVTLLIMSSGASAQTLLVNGDFEDNDGGTLAGWEWTCEEPLLITNPAPNGGSWAVAVRAIGGDSCGWTRLFQKLPFVVDGDLVRISGWARHIQGTQNTGAHIALGTRNNGVLSIHASEASFAFEWNLVTVEWNATLTANDTAVVVVSAGELIGQGLSYASFDGIDLDLNTGISGPASDKMTMIIHDGYLLATLMDGSYIRSAHLCDASGRPVRMAPADRHMAEFKLGGLSSGLYILALRTDRGTAIRKLVLH